MAFHWEDRHWRRVKALALLLPLVMDCLVNMCGGGSFKQTLSAEAWRNKDHFWWGWSRQAIDCLFHVIFRQVDHCQRAAANEDAYKGNVWAAWAANFD